MIEDLALALGVPAVHTRVQTPDLVVAEMASSSTPAAERVPKMTFRGRVYDAKRFDEMGGGAALKAFYALSLEERVKIASRLKGIPISVEHSKGYRDAACGHVTNASITTDGSLDVEFELDTKTLPGTTALALMFKGLKELSLSHGTETLKPLEVSLCYKGARPNTRIMGMDVHNPSGGISSYTYTDDGEIKCVSASASAEEQSDLVIVDVVEASQTYNTRTGFPAGAPKPFVPVPGILRSAAHSLNMEAANQAAAAVLPPSQQQQQQQQPVGMQAETTTNNNPNTQQQQQQQQPPQEQPPQKEEPKQQSDDDIAAELEAIVRNPATPAHVKEFVMKQMQQHEQEKARLLNTMQKSKEAEQAALQARQQLEQDKQKLDQELKRNRKAFEATQDMMFRGMSSLFENFGGKDSNKSKELAKSMIKGMSFDPEVATALVAASQQAVRMHKELDLLHKTSTDAEMHTKLRSVLAQRNRNNRVMNDAFGSVVAPPPAAAQMQAASVDASMSNAPSVSSSSAAAAAAPSAPAFSSLEDWDTMGTSDVDQQNNTQFYSSSSSSAAAAAAAPAPAYAPRYYQQQPATVSASSQYMRAAPQPSMNEDARAAHMAKLFSQENSLNLWDDRAVLQADGTMKTDNWNTERQQQQRRY